MLFKIKTPRLDSLTVSLQSRLEFIRPIAEELTLKWLGNYMLVLFDRLDTIIKQKKSSSDSDKEKSLQAWNLDWLMLRQLFNHSEKSDPQMRSANAIFTAFEPLSNHDKPNNESNHDPFDDLVKDCAMDITGIEDQEALIKTLSIFKKCKLDAKTVALFQNQPMNPLVTFAKALTLIKALDLEDNQNLSAQKLAQVLKVALFNGGRKFAKDVLPVLLAIGQVLQRMHKRSRGNNTPMQKLLTIFELAINRQLMEGVDIRKCKTVPNTSVTQVLLTMGKVANMEF